MAKARKPRKGKVKDRSEPIIKVGTRERSTGRTKGRKATTIEPTVTIDRRRRRRRTGGRKGRSERVSAEHLLDLALEDVTPAARRTRVGARTRVLGSGPRLLFLSPRGVLGLASREASELMRAALTTSPGARLESRVTAVAEGAVSVRVDLLREGGADERVGRSLAEEPAAARVTAAVSRRRGG